MKENGLPNRQLSRVLAEQGHGDLLMVTDAGFAIPQGVEVVDLSLDVNLPMVVDVLNSLKKVYSVEKMILADETTQVSPSLFKKITTAWGENMTVETVSHVELKEMSRKAKAVVRTGDFTAFGNVILVSGCGDRWYCEQG